MGSIFGRAGRGGLGKRTPGGANIQNLGGFIPGVNLLAVQPRASEDFRALLNALYFEEAPDFAVDAVSFDDGDVDQDGNVPDLGGWAVTFTGAFQMDRTYVVTFNGTPLWGQGQSRLASTVKPLSRSRIIAVAPSMASTTTPGTFSLTDTTTGIVISLDGPVIVKHSLRKKTFDFRGLFPPKAEVRPRSPDTVTFPPPAIPARTGLLPAATSAMGDVLNRLHGGLYTRIAQDADIHIGDPQIPTTGIHQFPASGYIALGGQQYFYDDVNRITSQLLDITWTDVDGTVNVGLRYEPRDGDVITLLGEDVEGRSIALFSDFDKLSAATFLDTATGSDLDAVGRSAGVPRPYPSMTDDVYREVIRAMNRAPRGSMMVIRKVLEAIYGVGNFNIRENFPVQNNTITIERPESEVLVQDPTGRAFLDKHEQVSMTMASRAFTLPDTPDVISRVKFAKRRETLNYMTGGLGLPSAHGWVYSTTTGTIEGAVWQVNPGPGLGNLALSTGGDEVHYTLAFPAALIDWVDVDVGVFLNTISGVDLLGFILEFGVWQIGGVTNRYRVVVQDIGSGMMRIGTTTDGLTFEAGKTIDVDASKRHSIRLVGRVGNTHLFVNGVFVGRPNSASGGAFQGIRISSTSPGVTKLDVDVINVGFRSVLPVNGLALGLSADTPTTTDVDWPNGATFLGFTGFTGADVGKHCRVTQSASNANARADGRWRIEEVLSPQRVRLGGIRQWGLRLRAGSNVVEGLAGRAFRYPFDVGKVLNLTEAEDPANVGVYPITAILHPDTGLPLTGTHPMTSNRATVSGSSFATEDVKKWRFTPNFVPASTAGFSFAAATTRYTNLVGSFSAAEAVQVDYSRVKSALVLPYVDVRNDPVGTFWPAYMPASILGRVADLLDQLTAAGVIVDARVVP